MNHRTKGTALAALVLLASVPAGPARAQEEKKLGWSDTAELSYVVTGGNSETQTLGFKNVLERRWERSLLRIKAGAIRAESTVITRIGIDQNADPNIDGWVEIDEEERTDLTAESYHVNGRYGHEITKRFFWHAGAGWERNRFAGLENRYSVFGGVGNIWIDSGRTRWATSYAATYTDQEDVIPDPEFDDTYVGFQIESNYELKIGAASKYVNDLVIDGNADESKDLRADWTNSLAVAINKNLALKVSLQILYDNRPSFEEVEVFETDPGPPPGLIKTGETVLVELDMVDTVFTSSLVVNF